MFNEGLQGQLEEGGSECDDRDDHSIVFLKQQMQAQQKQADSEGEFESFAPQVQTITSQVSTNQVSNSRNNHPRTKQLSEKQKFGLLMVPALTEPEHCQPPRRIVLAPNGRIIKVGSATFRSNFQSGHIGEVQLIGVNSFRISLDQQSNSTRNNTWFYFTVQGVKGEAHFLIKGFTKSSSLYNQGMKVCYRDNHQYKWRRGGSLISYQSYNEGEEDKKYCLKFTYFFRSNENSSLEFAYSFPYSLQKLNLFLGQLQPKAKLTSLGNSFEGRNIPLVTLGNKNSLQLIIISARVHPGQSGSSFIAEGFLKQMFADTQHSRYLLDRFMIKVVPMINVDGVFRGNYRFSAAGVDLNRKWKQPSQQHHPQIYFLKEMIRKESKERKLRMFIDIHGHSRKKNVFFYGCCRGNQDEDDISQAKAFPFLMSKISNAFSYEDCSFNIQKDKEGTARVTLFKEFKIHQIFTLQSSFFGMENGGNFCEVDYEKIGRKLCEGICAYFYEPSQIHSSFSSKLVNLKQKALKELTSNPELLKVGSEENSGSDSQPQKGELPEKVQKELEKQDLSRKRGSNLSSNQNYRRMTPKVPSSLKQKSEATIDKDMKQKQFYKYLLQAPSHLLDADFKNRQNCFKNHRVHSTVKDCSYLKYQRTKAISFFEEGHDTSTLMSQISNEKTKINLLMGREGAQYRRVRKIAEQSLKHEASERVEIEVKGIKGNKIEIDHSRIVSKIRIPEKGKFRRTSAEMFFKKSMQKDQKHLLQRNELNVQCRGRQIIF